MAPVSRVPKGSTILVTGASGFIGSQTVDVLLELGYNVRGISRSEKPWLDQYFADKHGSGRYQTVAVLELGKEDALEGVMEGADAVAHVASDMSLDPDPRVVVSNVVAQTQGVLRTAAKNKSVKSVVLVSSCVAAFMPKLGEPSVVVGQDTWNDDVVAAAFSGKVPEDQISFAGYAASKTEGERAAWTWVKENKPAFAFSTVLPNLTIGEILVPEKMPASTMGFIREYLKGTPTVPFINLFPSEWVVNVRDIARLIVAGLLDTSVHGERLYGFAEPATWTDIWKTMRKLKPENTTLGPDPVDEGYPLSDAWAESKKAEDLIKSFFGVSGWTGLEESLRTGIKDL